jgi:arylsulfatase A-like enzyme
VADRPNILLITTDTQRCDTLACMGNPHALSPHLDRLAGEGVLFDQAHAASPVCMPTRCSLMTGLHTPIHGAIENGIERRTDVSLLPNLLKDGGYHTIMVGKGDFGPPESYRFDVCHLLKGEKGRDVDDFYAEHLRARGYSRATKRRNPVPEDLFCEAFLVDTTIREIDRAVDAGGGRPFFAFCSMLSPHAPLDPPGRWADAYQDRPLPPLNYRRGEAEQHPRQLRRLLELEAPGHGAAAYHSDGTPDMDVIDKMRRLYYGLAAYVDAQVGRLIDHLDGRGLRERTLVIFSSDHGTTLYDHGFNGKHNYYDESWRVPLILSMPGTVPRGERRGFAIWNDLTATILGTAGVPASFVQGFDLLTPLVRGEPSPRGCAVATLMRSCALATQGSKLEYYFDEGAGRLFDRLNDPDEQHDLYADPAHRDVRDALLHALLTWRSELMDIESLQARTTTGGAVGRRVVQWVKEIRGTDAEQRLNERAAAIDRATVLERR